MTIAPRQVLIDQIMLVHRIEAALTSLKDQPTLNSQQWTDGLQTIGNGLAMLLSEIAKEKQENDRLVSAQAEILTGDYRHDPFRGFKPI